MKFMKPQKKYIIIGMGYVAERHLRAIKETGGELIACLDIHDSVGILDSYFPDCKYFSEFERFDRFCADQNINPMPIGMFQRRLPDLLLQHFNSYRNGNICRGGIRQRGFASIQFIDSVDTNPTSDPNIPY